MERALALEHLALALGEGDRPALPSPEELQAIMAEAEISLFTGEPAVSEKLLTTGWYLHGVASSDPAEEIYPRDRQRRAFQISAHIFDLALLDERDLTKADQLRLAFAAQVGYRRGELDPNATAVFRRVRDHIAPPDHLLLRMPTLALEAGTYFLALEPRGLREWLSLAAAQLRALRRRLGVDDLDDTAFGPAARVIWGTRRLGDFLTSGGTANLEGASTHFDAALRNEHPLVEVDTRWVAAHLLRLTDALSEGSVWSVLPPDVPPSARQALTLSTPPVLTLWPPQRELLKQEPSPLSSDVKRLVMSVPTSAGKTLIAQLLIVSHLATNEGSVCYVAPMRSLGREVRRSIATRLRILDRKLGKDLPDLASDFGWLADLLIGQEEPDVDVMTPERLLNLLRNDAERVLDRYRLFIFDEAQLLGEKERGFVLEQVLTFLHWRTLGTGHRILLLSAALGNRGQLVQWLSSGHAGSQLFESEWRGPRRLHALFSTNPTWDSPTRVEEVASNQRPWRVVYPLVGSIRIRPASGQTQRLRLVEPVGELALRRNSPNEFGGRRDSGHSTPLREPVAQLAAAIGATGPVLVVTSTRDSAKTMAQSLAALLPEAPRASRLRDLVARRLGNVHPLVDVVGHGVAFHHAGLPLEILDALEEAFRDGTVGFLSCTTTLTEGVNLPARAVFIFETPTGGDDVEPLLLGARLVNAVGRAGRAGKESEGWIIMALQTEESADDFALLEPAEEELEVRSRLTADDVLSTLAEYEEAMRAGEDAVFSDAAVQLTDFIAFVWFVLASEESRGTGPAQVALEEALATSLGFTQATAELRNRWTRVAEGVRSSYTETSTEARLRYAKRGTSISTAVALDELVDDLYPTVRTEDSRDDPDVAQELLRSVGTLRRLLELPEAPRWRFKTTRTGPIQLIDVDPEELLSSWLNGESPQAMSDRYLAAVSRRDWAIEQVVDALTAHFEMYLSWMVGAVVESVNARLSTADTAPLFCQSMPAFIRYGVKSTISLELLTSGIRSRQLANSIAETAAQADVATQDLPDWIGGMAIPEWRAAFDATPGDILDLLDYARRTGSKAVLEMLEQAQTTLSGDFGAEIDEPLAVRIRRVDTDPAPQRLGIVDEDSDELVGTVPVPLHNEIDSLLDTGLIEEITLLDAGNLLFRRAEATE